MNMKNIFKIGIVTLSLAMGLSSCNDFFDSIPGETYDMEGTFSNRSKTMEFLNNVYSYVNNENSETVHDFRWFTLDCRYYRIGYYLGLAQY